MTAPSEIPGRQQSIRVIFGALMLVMLLASLDQTIVSTALPTIVGELGGLEHLSWIVTAYLLATTMVTPVYGKLGDLFGRKIVLQTAIVLFLLGSGLCGISRSMGQLIAFRALQGLGGGGLMVTTMAAVGDILSPAERGRYQGIFGGVFGLSTVVGPLIGGFFVQHLSWRWIFYINLPLGLISVAVIGAAFTAPRPQGRRVIDYAGVVLLGIALTAIILFTSLGGHTIAWGSGGSIGLLLAAIAATGAFLFAEYRAPEPLLPLRLFANRIFLASCTIGFIVGLALFGSVTYMPMYLQVVKSVSPSTAGLLLTPMMGGVLVSSIASGQIISRIGRYRVFPIIGTAVMTGALGLVATLGIESRALTASAYVLVLGLGLGMVMQVLILAVQNAVDYRDLGVATSGATLFRSIGGSVGVSIFGAIFSSALAQNLAGVIGPGASLPSATDPAAIQAMPAALRQAYLLAFTKALHPVFITADVIAAFGFALSWTLEELPLRRAARAETIGESFAMPHDATSLEELELIVTRLQRRENRWRTYERLAERAGVSLAPDEIWLLAQICLSSDPLDLARLEERYALSSERLHGLVARLVAKDLAATRTPDSVSATPIGRDDFRRLAASYRSDLAHLCERWGREHGPQVEAALDKLAQALMSDLPTTA